MIAVPVITDIFKRSFGNPVLLHMIVNLDRARAQHQAWCVLQERDQNTMMGITYDPIQEFRY